MSEAQYFWFNGESVDAAYLASDRGFAFGDGVFETIAYIRSCLPLLPLHNDRLTSSCQQLQIRLDIAALMTCIEDCMSQIRHKHETGRIKIIVSRGAKGLGCYPQKDDTANVSLIFTPANYILQKNTEPSRLRIATTPLYDMPIVAGLKHLNRLNYIVAALGENADGEGDEMALLDTRGNIIETMHCNIFFICAADKCVYTPSLNLTGVRGVMRTLVAEKLASRCGLQFVEKQIPVGEIHHYDEAFIGNALRGILPVEGIYGEGVSVNFPSSELSFQLQNELQQYLVEVA